MWFSLCILLRFLTRISQYKFCSHDNVKFSRSVPISRDYFIWGEQLVISLRFAGLLQIWRAVDKTSQSKKKFQTLPSAGKVMCAVFWDRKSVILLDFLEPRQTINSDQYIAMLSWRLKFPESGQRRRQPFSCNTIMPGPLPVWKLWSTLSILAGLLYDTHHIVRICRLLTSICSGRWKMECVGNIFLATMPSYKLWNSGPPPLVQIFTSTACRLLFVAGESA